MLDFLRRKDRRKQPSHDNILHAHNAPPSASPGLGHAPSSAPPLRDRNPQSSAGLASAAAAVASPASHSALNLQALHRAPPVLAAAVPAPQPPPPGTLPLHGGGQGVQNGHHHVLRHNNVNFQPPAVTRRVKPPPADKENAARGAAAVTSKPPPPPQPKQADRADTSVEPLRSRWGKRQQHMPQPQPHAPAAPATGAPPPVAGAGGYEGSKKKRNRRFKNKHEPAVLAKSVPTDRRRSVKVMNAAHVVHNAKSGAAVAAAVKRPTTPKASASPATAPAEPHAAAQAERRGQPQQQPQQPQPLMSSNAAIPPQEAPNLTWPHTDLAAMLRSGDITHADVAVRRIAMAASRDNPTRVKMVSEGVAGSLIALLSHSSFTLDMRRDATHAIAELAVHDACEDALLSANVIPVLVWLITVANNTDIPTLSSACRGLRNLLGGKETTARYAAKYGCVEPLLALVAGRTTPRIDNSEVVVEAVAAVSNLLHHGQRFQGYVIKHGGLSALSALGTSTDNDEAMFHVVNVLAECAKETRWHKSIVAADGLLIAFRALRNARDLEVVSEASRLIGNVAVTHKARVAVREAGGLAALLDRLSRCPSFKKPVPGFDIVSALANVCADSRAASDALSQKDAAGLLLNMYTNVNSCEGLVKASFNALQVLAQGSATRRAKVLYSVGIYMKQAAMAGQPVKRLYDLRQAILEDIESGDKDSGSAMPESLERLSRASVRMINSGVVRGYAQLPNRGSTNGNAAGSPGHPSRLSGNDGVTSDGMPRRGQQAVGGTGVRADGTGDNPLVRRSPERERNRFKSTGRVVSVTHKPRRRHDGPGLRQLAEGGKGGAPDEEDVHELPRGNEEVMKLSDSDLRARMLEREADGNMTQEFFEIGQVLGKGGYGSVFLAKDLRTEEIVAIKRFHNSGTLVDKKAIKEQNIWKGLHHINVVEFKGSFVGDNGSLNLVVEYVDGLSLAEHLSQYTAFPETLVAEIARQVLCGLLYLHENGVTHRDLKPANILVDNNAAVKICDFGVSRSENVQTINPGQQHMVGTPWYIAPEMVEYRPYTTGVDIWSLGCTVLELATGRRPYHELSAMQVLFRMVEDRCPPIPSHLSPEAKDFLKSCWVWDPQERPSAQNLLRHPFILKARKFIDSSKESSIDNTSTSGIDELFQTT